MFIAIGAISVLFIGCHKKKEYSFGRCNKVIASEMVQHSARFMAVKNIDYTQIEKGLNPKWDIKITLKNGGKQPAIINSVLSGCGCIKVEYSKKPILPGKETIIKVVYTALNGEKFFSKSIMAMLNGGKDYKIIKLKSPMKYNP